MLFYPKNNLISILIYSLIFISEGVFAQKSQDSLSKYSYLELDNLIHSTEKNTVYLNYYIQKAKRENINEEIALYYKNYVFYQEEENRIAFIDSSFYYAHKTNDKALIGDVYRAKGVVYYNIKNYILTLDNYLKANDYINQTDDAYKKHRINIKLYSAKLRRVLSVSGSCLVE